MLNSLKHERESVIVTRRCRDVGRAVVLLARARRPVRPRFAALYRAGHRSGPVRGTLSAAFFVYRAAGAVAPPLTLVRVLLGVGVATTLGRFLPHAGKILTPVYAVLVALAYLLILLVTRELAAADLTTLRAVTAKRGAR